MSYHRRNPEDFDWWMAALIIAGAVLFYVMLSTGCKTCPPQKVVKVPVEVQVPVPVNPEKIHVPEKPHPEICDDQNPRNRVCDQQDEKDRLDCMANNILTCASRNVTKLRVFISRLVAEIEAHNAAIED